MLSDSDSDSVRTVVPRMARPKIRDTATNYSLSLSLYIYIYIFTYTYIYIYIYYIYISLFSLLGH